MAAAEVPVSEAVDRTIDGLVDALVVALAVADRSGSADVSAMVAIALQFLSCRHGGVEALVVCRPGSWDAEHVRASGATEMDQGWL